MTLQKEIMNSEKKGLLPLQNYEYLHKMLNSLLGTYRRSPLGIPEVAERWKLEVVHIWKHMICSMVDNNKFN